MNVATSRNKAATTNLCPAVRCDKIKGWRDNRLSTQNPKGQTMKTTQAPKEATMLIAAAFVEEGDTIRGKRVVDVSTDGRTAWLVFADGTQEVWPATRPMAVS